MGTLVFGLVLLAVAFFLRLLRELKSSNNLVILVPTSGGIPMLNIGDLRRNLRQP